MLSSITEVLKKLTRPSWIRLKVQPAEVTKSRQVLNEFEVLCS